MPLPTESAARKGMPIYSGLISYFPHAVAAVAELSRVGNDQHNPGQPLHWAKEKSQDELDALCRHLTDLAIDPLHRDPDGVLAAVKVAWRALANIERMADAGVDVFHVEPARPEVPLAPTLPGHECLTCGKPVDFEATGLVRCWDCIERYIDTLNGSELESDT